MQSTPPRPQLPTTDDRGFFQPYAPPSSQPGFPPFAHPNAPFAPPQTVMPGLPGAHVALFSTNLVALATFLGSALGGAVVLAINEHRLGRRHAAVVSVILGALGSAVTVGIGFLLPDNFPGAPLGLLPILVLRVIAQKRQAALVSAHVSAGGKQGSGWAAVGIGFASLAAVMIPVFIVALIVALVSDS